MRLGTFTVDYALSELFNLLEADTILAIKSLPDGIRERFFKLLTRGFHYSGLNISPPTAIRTTTGTGEATVFGRFVWNREFIAAALLAAKSELAVSDDVSCPGIRIVCHP